MMIRAAQIASHRRYIPACKSAEPRWAVDALLDPQQFAKKTDHLCVCVSATAPCHFIPCLQKTVVPGDAVGNCYAP